MSRKKAEDTGKDDSQKALEQRVDAMMSIEKSSAAAKPAPAGPVAEPEENPIPESEKAQSTAPQLPSQLLKTLGGKSKASTLKIVKAEPAEEEPTESESTKTSEEPAPDTDPIPPGDPLEDSATDNAVDDIMAKEADMQLAVDDAVARRQAAEAETSGPGLIHRFFASPWTWLFIIGIAAVAYAWFHTSL